MTRGNGSQHLEGPRKEYWVWRGREDLKSQQKVSGEDKDSQGGRKGWQWNVEPVSMPKAFLKEVLGNDWPGKLYPGAWAGQKKRPSPPVGCHLYVSRLARLLAS